MAHSAVGETLTMKPISNPYATSGVRTGDGLGHIGAVQPSKVQPRVVPGWLWPGLTSS